MQNTSSHIRHVKEGADSLWRRKERVFRLPVVEASLWRGKLGGILETWCDPWPIDDAAAVAPTTSSYQGRIQFTGKRRFYARSSPALAMAIFFFNWHPKRNGLVLEMAIPEVHKSLRFRSSSSGSWSFQLNFDVSVIGQFRSAVPSQVAPVPVAAHGAGRITSSRSACRPFFAPPPATQCWLL